MEFLVLRYIFVFMCFSNFARSELTPCSSIFKVSVSCLEYIKQKFEDPNAYYFGTAFTNVFGCNYQNVTKMLNIVTDRRNKCVNERPAEASGTYMTLGSRLFVNNDFKSSQYFGKLAGVVHVQFVSPPHIYQGCNTTAQLTTNSLVNIDPGTIVQAVLVRNPPTINFPMCDLNHLCTIIFFDAGHMVLHNIWTNWPKTNNPLSNFTNPGHGGLQPNPYVFLVYRQQNEIRTDVSSQLTDVSSQIMFKIDDFVKQYNLEGPIGINWMNVLTDISAQETLTNLGLGNNCATMIETIINKESPKLQRELGVNFPVDFDLWMTTKFQNNRTSTWVDSMKNGFVSSNDVKSKPDVYLQSDMFFPMKEDLNGQTYSLLLVQPSTVINGGSQVALHWLLINGVNGDLASGIELVSYNEPTANSYLSNQFYVLLLKQPKSLDRAEVEKYFESNCKADTKGNMPCMFQLAPFMKNNQLNLSALTRFRVAENLRQMQLAGILGKQ